MSVSLKMILWPGVMLAVVVTGLFFRPMMVLAAEQPAVSADVQVDPESFKKEIERLKNEKDFETKRVEEMRQEREQFVKEIRRVENLNTKYTKELDEMRAKAAMQEQSFEDRMKKMEAQIKESSDMKPKVALQAPSVDPKALPPVEVEKKANEVLMKGGDLDPEDEKFKEELARAHYNMGNVYFERGEYQRSVVEYYQAVDLMPYDADAHYNLAFVSGEYVGDQETALKHYQWYLYLKPNTDDRKLIEEKIVAAKTALRSRISDSKAENSELNGHLNIAR
ncbi:MAG: tetratricopeptide repeat protein [Candidatus Omnitrophica bacterium]|nr:tetratricopeptide repeat protein [Candidatus Omnitrophota bacterium]